MYGRIAAVAAALVLAACGGGGGGEGSDAAVKAPQKKTVLIYAEGDSTMVGYLVPTGPITPGVPSRTQYIPTTVMQNDLQQWFGGTDNITVENHAVGGTTVGSSVNGTAGYQPLASRLSESKAQIVVANYGINDQILTTPEQYKQDWQIWINTVKSLGKIPVMIERNPICVDGAPDAAPYLAAEREVATANGVTLVAQYDAILAMPNWKGLLGDCMHPTDDLYKIMSQKDADGIKPIVASLQ